MKRTGDRLAISRGCKAANAILLSLLATGCASQAALDGSVDTEDADRDAAGDLYEGQPSVVHATEFPVMSAIEGITRGDAAWSRGELELAVYLYIQSLAYDTSSPVPFLKIGSIHERRGNRALAEKAFEQALQLNPELAAATERLALLYLQGGRDDAARPLLERAISLEPSRWQSHNGLGIAADRRKDFAVAIAHYDAALELEPRAGLVLNNRGYSRYLAGDYAGSESDFRGALALGAQSGTWSNLGRAQARQGRYAEALKSLLHEHDEAHARNLLGETALEADDLEAAQNQFALALSASPRYFEAAQENLDHANKRIAERAMGGDGKTQVAASAAPPPELAAASVPPVAPVALGMYR